MNNFLFFININTVLNQLHFFINSSNETQAIFYKKINLDNFSENEFQFKSFEKILKEIIVEVENKFRTQINKVNLMLENQSSDFIEITIEENFEDKNINKTSLEYLFQNIRQQIIMNHPEKKIVHIIIKKCSINGEEYNNIPIGKKCKKLIIELNFIYLQKIFVSKIESILNNFQINVDKIICTNYAKSLLTTDIEDITKAGLTVLEDKNINEVGIYPKKITKLGFFEKLFHIFS